jgi:D-3-phosphoglycerate dehydrogenase / 2-oxoglutarate reductase
MAEWKILITDGLNESGQAIMRSGAAVDDRPDISADELLSVVGDYDALVVRGRTKVTPEVFAAANKLKVVGRAGVGVDNINLEAAKAHGVAVVNAPKSTTLAVAELTLGLLLAVARAIPRADRTMKQGEWIKKQLEGVELRGKTLGIIGMGNIGSALGRMATALGMSVLGYDPLVSGDEIEARGARHASLQELFSKSDFISLHVPLNDATRGMINAQSIALMKKGVRLVCAARGGVVEEAALLEALNSGQVAAAGLDVFAKEPPGLSALVTHPNVVATPHIGAQTEEAQVRASEDIATEVLKALKGEALRWKVV